MIAHKIAESHLHRAISLIVALSLCAIIISLTSMQHTRNCDIIKFVELNDRINDTKLMAALLLVLQTL